MITPRLLLPLLLLLLPGRAIYSQTLHFVFVYEQDRTPAPVRDKVQAEVQALAQLAELELNVLLFPSASFASEEELKATLFQNPAANPADRILFYYHGRGDYDNENLLEDFPYFTLRNGDRIFQSHIHQLLRSKGVRLLISAFDATNDKTGSFGQISSRTPMDGARIQQLFATSGDIQITGYSRFEASNFNREYGGIFTNGFFQAFRIVGNPYQDAAVTWENLLACTQTNIEAMLKAAGKKQAPYYTLNIPQRMKWDDSEEIAYAPENLNYGYQIPAFPFPPPRPSSQFTLDRSLFEQAETFADVDETLSRAISNCKYFEKSYFSVPEGFALVTRIEQIDEEAFSLKEPDRWSADIGPLEEFSLSSYLKALFFGQTGYFRVFVFMVTSRPFTNTGVATEEQAREWLSSGLNKLPKALGELPVTENHNCTVLVYEFEKKESGDQAFLQPGMHSARTHLDRSNILQYIQR